MLSIDASINLKAYEYRNMYYLDPALEQNVISRLFEKPQQRYQDSDEEVNPDLEDVGGYVPPQSKNYIYPRLFVIYNNNSGYELLAKEQLEYYFRIAKNRPECLKQRRSVMVGGTLAKSHYFVTKVKNMQDMEIEFQ